MNQYHKERAAKEMEVLAWMQKKGYDRKAIQEIAPIIVQYLDEAVKIISPNPDVMQHSEQSVCEHQWSKVSPFRICIRCGFKPGGL